MIEYHSKKVEYTWSSTPSPGGGGGGGGELCQGCSSENMNEALKGDQSGHGWSFI